MKTVRRDGPRYFLVILTVTPEKLLCRADHLGAGLGTATNTHRALGREQPHACQLYLQEVALAYSVLEWQGDLDGRQAVAEPQLGVAGRARAAPGRPP